MSKKTPWLLLSQISGTVWFAVALIAVLAFVFFFFPQRRNSSSQHYEEQKNIAELQKKEDSVYLSRRADDGLRKQPVHSSRTHYQRSDTILADRSRYYTTTPPPATRQPLRVELNSADTTTLQLLHGIGPVYARRIVNHRDKLGGFISLDQLLEVNGFTPELLDHIRPYLSVDTAGLHKIDVNTLTLKQLIRHPYMEYYFARDLVNLRARGVVFRSFDDLRTIPSASDTLIDRLLPYLDF